MTGFRGTFIRAVRATAAIAAFILLPLSSPGGHAAADGPTACPVGQYLAQYYANQTLSGSPVLTRCEAAPLNARFGATPSWPPAGIGPNQFSVRWSGQFAFSTAGAYTFTVTGDDGTRLSLDNQVMIDRFVDQPPTTYSYTVANMAAGNHAVRVEYYQAFGGATAQLSWLLSTQSTGPTNVRSYGATGNGATDDTAAIQAAINAQAPGSTVYFPAGTYIVAPTRTTWITLKSGVSLAGDGASSILRVRPHQGDWQHLLSSVNRMQGVTIRDLRLDANTANNPEATVRNLGGNQDPQTFQVGIQFYGADCAITGVTFDVWSGVWAVFATGTNFVADNNRVTFAQNAAHADYDNSMFYLGGSGYEMKGNIFTTAITQGRGGRAAMEAHGGPAVVANNTSAGFRTLLNVTDAYTSGGDPGAVDVYSNTTYDALTAVALWPTAPNEQHGTKIHDNTLNVDWVKHGDIFNAAGVISYFDDEASTLAGDIEVRDNRITFVANPPPSVHDPANTAGIGILNQGGATRWTIAGNTIANAPGAAIVIGCPYPSGNPSFTSLTVRANTIQNAGANTGFDDQYRTGIYVAGHTGDLTLTNNTISDTSGRTKTAWFFAHTGQDAYESITISRNVNVQGLRTVDP